MLVLQMVKGDRIYLATKPTQTVLECIRIEGQRLRIGIDAPQEIKIVREQALLTQFLRENPEWKERKLEGRNFERTFSTWMFD